MDFRVEESSDSSSEEEEEQLKESIDTAKRSYECSFCRRGFTNAQALGGHMNIHRKDRAKAKQISLSSSVQMNQKDDQSDPPKSSSYPFFETQSDYQLYFQPPPANPHADFHDSPHWYVRNSQPSGSTQELLGTNLSLRIGPRISEAEVGSQSIWKNDEVDLELRLGHDP